MEQRTESDSSHLGEISSDDPLAALNLDVFDLIFQHLSPMNMLTSASVSNLWNNAIGESRTCMAKVKITILNNFRPIKFGLDLTKPATDLSALISVRQYRNIYADFSEHCESDILEVLSPKERKWRNVHLLNANFKKAQFFDFFHESVENLTLARVHCDETKEDEKKTKTFPNLKSLTLFSCNAVLMKHIEDCTGLTELHVSLHASESENGQRHEREIFEKFLINNKNLDKLSILSQSCNVFLSRQLSVQTSMKLTKLVIDSFKEFSTDEGRDSLVEFLKAQSNSLLVLDINPWCGHTVVKVSLSMPNLRDLTLNLMNREENIDWIGTRLNRNPSIQRLHLRNISPRESLDVYNLVFNTTPNIKIYKSKYMHVEDLVSISQRCRKVEELYIEQFNVPLLPNENCLPSLKKFKSWDINDDLAKSLRAKGVKNDFEKLVLAQLDE